MKDEIYMIVNPNKLITIFASFSNATQEIVKDVEDVSVRLYKGNQHITDMPFERLASPLSWKATHVFPKDAQIGSDYKAIFSVKFKDEKNPVTEEQDLELVRDLNLSSHVEIKDLPKIVQDDTYTEVPSDIRAYLENKND